MIYVLVGFFVTKGMVNLSYYEDPKSCMEAKTFAEVKAKEIFKQEPTFTPPTFTCKIEKVQK